MLYEGFEDWDDVLRTYNAPEGFENALPLLAEYTQESYDGWSAVMFIHQNKLYTVQGSHCSCYGLEDQWDPELIEWDIAVEFLKRNSTFKAALPLVEILADSPDRESEIGEARVLAKLKYA